VEEAAKWRVTWTLLARTVTKCAARALRTDMMSGAWYRSRATPGSSLPEFFCDSDGDWTEISFIWRLGP